MQDAVVMKGPYQGGPGAQGAVVHRRPGHLQARRVSFELNGEKLDPATGAVVEQGSTRQMLTGANANANADANAEPVANTGSAVLTVPPGFASRYDRFYVQVHDAEADEVGGWSSGYFHIDVSAPTALAAPAAAAAAAAANPGKAVQASRLRGRQGSAPPAAADAAAAANPVADLSQQRSLAACASGLLRFSFGATAVGQLDSYTALSVNVPLGQALPPATLLPTQTFCV